MKKSKMVHDAQGRRGKMIGHGTTRRGFLQGAVGLAGLTVLPSAVVWGKPGQLPPSRRLNIAAIGVGGRGVWILREINRVGHNFVAWADVDHAMAHKGIEKFVDDFPNFANVPSFTDYRVMLDQMDKDIDAVMIAIPDHSHFHAAATCLSHNKHVYLEKPLAHDIAACRRLVELAAARPHLVTQMGNQGNSSSSRDMMEHWIKAGAIGEPVESYVWTLGSWFAEALEEAPPPASLDYDLWLNRAPWRPFAKLFHGFHWRRFRWFGSGMLGDWGAHQLNSAFYLLNLAHRPVKVSITTDDWPVPDSYPKRQTTVWEYPAHEGKPAAKVTYYVYRELEEQLEIVPRPIHLEADRDFQTRCGGVIVGSDASLMYDGYGQSARIIPDARAREVGKAPHLLVRARGGHQRNWFDACLGEQKTVSPFAYGAALTEMLLLSEMTLRSESKSIQWDPVAMKATNDSSPLVQEVIHGPPSREGWEV